MLIKLENLSKTFYTNEIETNALVDIHLTINKGEFVSLCGPSGCGKSTLLSLIGLLDISTSGSYLLNAKDVSALNRSERAQIRNKEIGFIFQAFNLISDLTVEENVMLPLTYRSDLTEKEKSDGIERSLSIVEMSHRRHYFPSQLSGGQQQRIAVARAIAGNPSIILADEPTGNLDSKNAEAVLTLFESLHSEGITICMVTHDNHSAERADRKIELFDGRLVADEKLKTV